LKLKVKPLLSGIKDKIFIFIKYLIIDDFIIKKPHTKESELNYSYYYELIVKKELSRE
jgi:hypothetical protein